MTHHCPETHAAAPSRVLAAVALLAGLLGATPATAQGGSVLNSATTERYRQQGLQGKKQHDYSPRTPPASGRTVYGHWTPYNPPDPASYPADARKHVIQRGDTLYEIATKYYKDGYLWPYVWEANSWVKYPHWIYPGDTLLIPPVMMLPEGKLEDAAPQLDDILAGYFPAGGAASVYCGHFIIDPNEKSFGEIIGSEADPPPLLSSAGDLVFINVGSKDGALPGDEFAIIYPREHLAINPAEMKMMRDEQLLHPITGEPLGLVMKMAGRLKIVVLGDEVSTAQITYSCDSIEPGWELIPFTETPIPLVRRKERERLATDIGSQGRGYIVWMEDMVSAGTLGALVSIDMGSKDGVIPGDVFHIFRDEKVNTFSMDVEHFGSAWDAHNAKRRAKPHRDANDKTIYGKQDPVVDVPPRMVGQLVVLYTQDHTATCRAFQVNTEYYIGDQVVYDPVDSGLSSVAVVDAPLQPGIPLSQQQQSLPRRSR